ncbi:MAG TPA: 2OG-Fe(II) oxygenase [Roseiarcus sp.]|nr:2OG-Fe(II) oxygenase [Roseiarcus sp.]
MPLLDLEALRQAPLVRDPFNFTVVKQAIRPADAAAIRDDFPDIEDSGLLPVEATRHGPLFRQLIRELQSEEVARAFSEKFGVNLVRRPQMITVRGRCAAKDGRIHTDSKTKLITVLIYFNDQWEAAGGRLRLLRSPTDLNDMIAEAPPHLGTMIAFRRSDKSYHGHEPYEGVRRYVMINWMTTDFAARRELFRHRVSARAKQAISLLKPRRAAKAGGVRD